VRYGEQKVSPWITKMTVEQSPVKILCVVGARPNFMKIAPVMRVLQGMGAEISASLLHTGQHYDEAMKTSFFQQLNIPEPDIDLEVGSASHAVQTAEIMRRFEPVLDELQPTAVLVVGDVNSTIACALVAVKKDIPVFHVEAGLRSYDRNMPEEINRVLTDQISELLFTTEQGAIENLKREGVDERHIHFVGNVMIDTLMYNMERAESIPEIFSSYKKNALYDKFSTGYGLVTLHRPSNVDDPAVLRELLSVLREISQKIPLIFPIHPRTRKRIADAQLEQLLEGEQYLILPPVGYLEMLGLMKEATMVLTDSGGIQEETTALGVPCITIRENTERPITVDQGTNTIVGTDAEKIRITVQDILSTGGKKGRVPQLWDGKAAERIGVIIKDWAEQRGLG
jgi:UDP-N-acetylglucosamine 2-epimerase (non-hydrolysing)